MPSIEQHVRFCVKVFGKQNRELCYMVNSWMDAPSRELGMAHRRTRHDFLVTPIEVAKIYGDKDSKKCDLVAGMVLQHLRLDGLVTPEQERNWSWKWADEKLKALREEREIMQAKMESIRRKREMNERYTWMGMLVGGLLGLILGLLIEANYSAPPPLGGFPTLICICFGALIVGVVMGKIGESEL